MDMQQDPLTLSELTKRVKEKITSSFPGFVWIIAEISEIRTNRTGHCYLELIEKSSEKEDIIAKTRGTIWSFTYRMIKPYFEDATGQTLKAGMKVLFKATVEFHEVYGFSLNIKDIDPNYTLGDIERKKRETIQRLEKEGIIDMNKETYLPPVPQKIAIISSPTAAGYQDFVHQLENNPERFKIYHHLFPAIVQGDDAPGSIIFALERIFEYESFFDAVVLIRGGGSSADLMCFDDYDVASNIAQFPLPVLTGIGHERDISVADMVAHTHLKTPTAAAEFIIQRITDFYLYLGGLENAFTDIVIRKLTENRQQIELMAQRITPLVGNSLERQNKHLENIALSIKRSTTGYVNMQDQKFRHYIDMAGYLTQKTLKAKSHDISFYKSKLRIETKNYLKLKQQHLHLHEETNKLSDPVNILNKGYSITYKDNKIIKSASGLELGDKIETTLRDGKVISTVSRIKK
jgi:exodeoxyribonuclease VII large subunit